MRPAPAWSHGSPCNPMTGGRTAHVPFAALAARLACPQRPLPQGSRELFTLFSRCLRLLMRHRQLAWALCIHLTSRTHGCHGCNRQAVHAHDRAAPQAAESALCSTALFLCSTALFLCSTALFLWITRCLKCCRCRRRRCCCSVPPGVPMGAGVRARGRSHVRSGAQQLAAQQEHDRVRVGGRLSTVHCSEYVCTKGAQVHNCSRAERGLLLLGAQAGNCSCGFHWMKPLG